MEASVTRALHHKSIYKSKLDRYFKYQRIRINDSLRTLSLFYDRCRGVKFFAAGFDLTPLPILLGRVLFVNFANQGKSLGVQPRCLHKNASYMISSCLTFSSCMEWNTLPLNSIFVRVLLISKRVPFAIHQIYGYYITLQRLPKCDRVL